LIEGGGKWRRKVEEASRELDTSSRLNGIAVGDFALLSSKRQ